MGYTLYGGRIHGNAVIMYKTKDISVFEKTKEYFEKYRFNYAFDYIVRDEFLIVYAQGYDKYSKRATTDLLKELKDIAPIEEDSVFYFREDYDDLWRYVIINGKWIHQFGRVLYQ